MARGKAEDAGGLTPAKDDNAALCHFGRRTLPIFKCVDYSRVTAFETFLMWFSLRKSLYRQSDRRAAAALPLTGSPGCAMGGAATGDKSGRDSVDGTVKTGGGASGHDVQNTYKNTAPILLEAVLCVRLTAYYVISFLFPFVKRR